MKLAVEFSRSTLIRGLVVVSCGFLAASLAVSFWALLGQADEFWFVTRLFDFDVKNNLPHFFKTLLLAGCSVAIFLNARAQAQAGGAFQKRWRVLGWIFLALTVDEEVQLHQQFVSPLIAWGLGVDLDGRVDARVYWVVPYLIFTALFCVAYVGFWWRLPLRVRLGFGLAGVIYVGGAAIVEELAHHYAKLHGDTNVPYLLLTNVSEWMQMLGSILFLHALCLRLAEQKTGDA